MFKGCQIIKQIKLTQQYNCNPELQGHLWNEWIKETFISEIHIDRSISTDYISGDDNLNLFSGHFLVAEKKSTAFALVDLKLLLTSIHFKGMEYAKDALRH